MPSPSELVRSMNERHYHFLSQSLNDLERQVERHRTEQRLIFNHLVEAGLIETRLEPHAKSQRRKTRRHRSHPYVSPMSTSSHGRVPSSLANAEPIDARHCRRSFNSSGPINGVLGTKENPIYVEGDDELLRCGGCWEEGHLILDCKREYRFDGQQYVPIKEGEIVLGSTYVIDAGSYQHE